MSSLTQIRNAIKTTLETSITPLHVYARAPSHPQLPAVVVIPAEADFDVAMGRGTDTWRFELHVLTSAGDDDLGQRKLDALVSGAGAASSIREVVFTNRTLGLADTTAHVSALTAYGLGMEAVEIAHIYATLTLVVETSGQG